MNDNILPDELVEQVRELQRTNTFATVPYEGPMLIVITDAPEPEGESEVETP